MINYKINYSEAAQNDLNEIFEYIAYSLKEFKTAQTLIRRIFPPQEKPTVLAIHGFYGHCRHILPTGRLC